MSTEPNTLRSRYNLYPRPYSRITVLVVIGLAAVIMGLWLLGTPGGVLGKADAVGYAICHRIPARSLHVHGRALPLCARCTGIYLGVMTALAVYAGSGRLRSERLPRPRLLVVLALAGVPIAVDGINSYLTFFPFYHPIYPPHNTIRLITGVYAGITMFTIILPVYNSTMWSAPRPDAPVNNLKELLLVYVVAALMIAAALVEWTPLLYLLALISTAGVVLMFSIIGSVLFITGVGRDGQARTWRDLALPSVGGLVFAISVIGLIDLVRFAFTGTWDGFTMMG
ncbi:MAG TPA: DUF2085 domain-containing protein [Aggregatilineaceae bacterium]|nr:DUF2085 domain-containing protein [Aggregatilineaceae bacterium]